MGRQTQFAGAKVVPVIAQIQAGDQDWRKMDAQSHRSRESHKVISRREDSYRV